MSWLTKSSSLSLMAFRSSVRRCRVRTSPFELLVNPPCRVYLTGAKVVALLSFSIRGEERNVREVKLIEDTLTGSSKLTVSVPAFKSTTNPTSSGPTRSVRKNSACMVFSWASLG